MSKFVLDVGNCSPDHGSITRLVEGQFDAEVLQTHGLDDTLDLLRKKRVDLVIVNRKLDRDYSDGLEIIKRIKAEPQMSDVPVMLLSNYPQYQQEAVAVGAVPGFGKMDFAKPETVEKLEKFLK